MAYPTAPEIPGPRGNRGGRGQEGTNFLANFGQGVNILNALTQYGQGQEDREVVLQKRQDRKIFMALVKNAERGPDGDYSRAFKNSMYQQNPELATVFFRETSLTLQEDNKFQDQELDQEMMQMESNLAGLIQTLDQLKGVNKEFYAGLQGSPGDPNAEFGGEFEGAISGSRQAGIERGNTEYQRVRPQMTAFFGNGNAEKIFSMPLDELLVPSYNPDTFMGAERTVMKNIHAIRERLSTLRTLRTAPGGTKWTAGGRLEMTDASGLPKPSPGFILDPSDPEGVRTMFRPGGPQDPETIAAKGMSPEQEARAAALALKTKDANRFRLRAEYEKGEGVQTYQEARGLLRSAMNTDPTGPGDQILVRAMVRIGEIGGRASIVTAAEFGIAKGAGGWVQWGEGMMKQITGDGELGNALRAQMKHQIGKQYLALGEEQQAWEARYTNLAKKAGFKDTSRIVRKMYGTEGEGFITPAALEAKMAEWKKASKVLGKGAEIIKADRDPETIPADELLEGRTYIYEGKKARWTGTTWEKAL